MSSKYIQHKYLPFKKTQNAVQTAKARIIEEASGRQYGLFTRWSGINKAVNRYCRFGKVILIAGMSGSGKSYFLNMLRQDFLDNSIVSYGPQNDIYLGDPKHVTDLIYDEKREIYVPATKGTQLIDGTYFKESRLILTTDGEIISQGINRNCEYNVVLVHFGYEMDAEDELIRSASTILGKSYGYLISSEWSKELNDYKKLTQSEINRVSMVLDTIGQRKEYYVSSSGNHEELYLTVKKVVEMNPGAKVIATLDHTLLSRRLSESSDMELQANIAMTAIRIKQEFDAMVVLLNQMNQNIESTERITNAGLHYPRKSDIHMGSQIWWACDTVIVNHRPKILGIPKYGRDELDTQYLIHTAILKNRQGLIGDVYLREDFAHGRIHYARKADFMSSSKKGGKPTDTDSED